MPDHRREFTTPRWDADLLPDNPKPSTPPPTPTPTAKVRSGSGLSVRGMQMPVHTPESPENLSLAELKRRANAERNL